jgi:cobyrinic acid a,c-diamide synthase
VLGAVFRRGNLVLPDRHLGLVQASELDGIENYLDALSEVITENVSLDALMSCARPAALSGASTKSARKQPIPPPGQRIALARDQAFSFTYPHVLEGWCKAGAEIRPFSPLADEPPDAAADAVWLPGGYPELHAGQLSACERFRKGLKEAAARGAVIHGECGGYMTLGAGLEDAAGERHEMAGLLGLETSFAKRKLHLGYRQVRLLADCAIGPDQSCIFGHEFHYASVLAVNDDPLLELVDAAGASSPEKGSRRGSVTGTFFHAIDGED